MRVKRRKKSLSPADPVARHRAKSNHEPREKLCPLLLVVHPNAVDVVHVSFQFQGGAGLAHAATSDFRMPRSGKHLRHLGGFEVRERVAVSRRRCRQVFDAVVNRLSAPFRSSESCGAAFCSEPPRAAETPLNGSGNAVKHLERWSQTVMSFRSSSTSRLN